MADSFKKFEVVPSITKLSGIKQAPTRPRNWDSNLAPWGFFLSTELPGVPRTGCSREISFKLDPARE